jgi:hypothetical protein
MYMFRQCNVNTEWIRTIAIAIPQWPCFLARLDRIGELPKKFFNFPCACPVPDLTQKAFPFAFLLDETLQASVSAAIYHILPASNDIMVSGPNMMDDTF